MNNRRAWLSQTIKGILAAAAGVLGLQAQAVQTWIAPGAVVFAPSCPVCHTPGALPGTAIVVADADGSFGGATLSGAVLFICQTCGCLFAGFIPT